MPLVTSVVDEQVKRAVPCFGESRDGVPVGEAELCDSRSDGSGRRLDRVGNGITCFGVADGEGYLGAGGGQRTRGFDPDAGRGTRHDRANGAEVDALEHVVCSAGGSESC